MSQHQPSHPQPQPQPQPQRKMTAQEYQQLVQNWQTAPITWNPDGVYGGIKEVRAGGNSRSFLYIVPGLGALLLLLAVFLPWLSLNLFGSAFSTNGIGALSAPPGFTDSMQKLSQSPDYAGLLASASAPASSNANPTSTTSQPYEAWQGWALIVLAVLCLALAVCGIALPSKGFAIATLVAGLVCLALAGWDWWRTWRLIDDAYKHLATGPVAAQAQTALIGFGVGFGLYMAVAASLTVTIGSILALALSGDTQA